ncbi:porphobilinogen synthase [Rhizobium brockwellii]|uniref:porphobilinogen synthase n=1 Tax=Rhizobium brockwellii TaxID=3019932 RepID=UPI000522E8FE|nr:porphobilinogen synthase [Rhizobium brockwellii]KPN22689.1 delta-aminolevulinic acid dehydratase [Rhizobium brockwellii]QJX09992.1 porphobilinogen synthase [Rhizobium brockwellii]
MTGATFPTVRSRRLRKTAALRSMFAENSVTMNDLIYPIFVEEEISEKVEISSMPGVHRIPEATLHEEIAAIYADGVKAIMMFGVSHHKTDDGSDSWSESGLLARMVRIAKEAAPELIVIADTCFCEYTSHSHCGVITDGHVDNDITIENLGRQAVTAARAGADMVAPSAMMDGQVSAIRAALDDAGFTVTPIMAYSSKFASSFYGPFREAAGSQLRGDRKAYQMDHLNGREALRESLLDEFEGADMLMVKPGMPYLDVLARLRERTLLPLVSYQVSGEYAMIKFAAKAGAIDEKLVVRESLGAFKRAGADLILTYFARDIANEGF